MTVSFEDLALPRDQELQKKRILQGCRPFRMAPRTARDGLSQIATPFRAARRARLELEGERHERLFLLGSGRIRLERRGPDGQVVHLAHLGRGDVAGDLSLSGGLAAESAVVVEEARGLTVPVNDLRELAVREPAIYVALGGALIERSRALEERLEGLLLRRVEARLAWLLLYLMDRWGIPQERGIMIATAIRHHEIAQMIGTGREWVTMTLMRLRKLRVLGNLGRRVVVLEVTALRDLAAGKSLE